MGEKGFLLHHFTDVFAIRQGTSQKNGVTHRSSALDESGFAHLATGCEATAETRLPKHDTGSVLHCLSRNRELSLTTVAIRTFTLSAYG